MPVLHNLPLIRQTKEDQLDLKHTIPSLFAQGGMSRFGQFFIFNQRATQGLPWLK